MPGAIITKQEEGTFLMLFNRSGYVLNFSTNDFDVFTTNSIGEALCAKYGLSKGKSLIAYLNSASDENRFKLLSDLFHYYEENMEYEYNENYEDDLYWGSSISRYDERYARIYKKCKTIIDSRAAAPQAPAGRRSVPWPLPLPPSRRHSSRRRSPPSPGSSRSGSL